jgi:RNA polymerase sigma-70 factor (ECF subfamily)
MTDLETQPFPGLDPAEAARLRAASKGDREEFSSLTEPYRHELQVHCYRILGSWSDSEDLVQETYLRAWRRLKTYEGRAPLRAWLYKIATNACLDELARNRRRRMLPSALHPAASPGQPITPPTLDQAWLEPVLDDYLLAASTGAEAKFLAQEAVSLAFLAALQALPARQRAVLILVDVLDWSGREVADLLETTVSAVYSALHRARVKLDDVYGSRKANPPTPADEPTQRLLDQYVQAWERADVARLVSLLRENATLLMPPSPSWFRGREDIGAFVGLTVFGPAGMFPGPAEGRWKMVPTRANGRHAFAFYLRAADKGYQAAGIQVLSTQAGQVQEIISFNNPALPERFGLPHILAR